ncbi:MAG: glycosyltransferase, partial [Candidatus Solibacter sp.]
MKPTALFLTAETPFPLHGGGALRSASLLEYLATRYQVDIIVFREPGALDPASQIPPRLVRDLTVIDLPGNGRGFAAKVLRNAARVVRRTPPLIDRFAGYARQIAAVLSGRHYDLGIIEHFWCAPYLEQLAPLCTRTVLDLHNVESVLHQRCASAEGRATAAAHRVFQNASLALERHWLPRFSLVLATSQSDADLVRAIAPEARLSVYPNALPPITLPTLAQDEAIVFSGNMEYHPNRTAVRFFHREIWPLLRERWPNLVWRLVGKNPSSISRIIVGDPRIQVVGAVEDAVCELARSRVAVVPLLTGSGTRLKILEAWAAGLPVVSTTLGAEGL